VTRPDGGRRRVPGTPEAGGWVNGVQDFETNSSVRTSTSIMSREGGGGRLETWVHRVLAGSSVCYKTRQNKNVCRCVGRGIEGFNRKRGRCTYVVPKSHEFDGGTCRSSTRNLSDLVRAYAEERKGRRRKSLGTYSRSCMHRGLGFQGLGEIDGWQ
jgi:hypothetical protein